MIKYFRNTLFLFIIVFCCLEGYPQKTNYAIRKVVIDPGHGGKDPGATVGKLYEKDIALDVALKTGKLIKKMYPDVEVIYTRDKDVFIPLDDRAEIANKHKADLFISIHVNIFSNKEIAGAETYILGQHRSNENLAVAKLENSVILLEDDYNTRYEGFDPNSAESYIMFELLQNEYLEQSRVFADKVQNYFISHAKRKDRGVRQAGFLVLRKTTMPSVLIELGFMSNSYEKEFIEKESGKMLFAEAILKAFSAFKTKFDEKPQTAQAQPKPLAEKATSPQTNTPKSDSLVNVSSLSGVWYGLQVLASKNLMKTTDPFFKNETTVYYVQENGIYKYFLGVSPRLNDAKQFQLDNKTKFKDSFLVSFEEGIKKMVK
jgi:N-acetylmuramoyl-L-alanine amidase